MIEDSAHPPGKGESAMPNDRTRPDPGFARPSAKSDPVYRQIVVMVERDKFIAATAAVYKFLDDQSVRYEKLPPIPEFGAVPVELAEGEDVSAVLEGLNTTAGVKVAEQNRYLGTTKTLIPPPMSVNDPLYRYQWALFQIEAEAAWAHPAATTPVIVAILDTGISTVHPDLALHLWDDGFGNHGFNVLTLTPDVEDEDGHGTLLAGTIAAVSNNAIGIAGTPWPLKLMAVKFHDIRTRPNALNALYAMAFAIFHRANVITAAWHLGLGLGFLQIAIEVANLRGVVFVAGAGNDGLDNDVLPTFPASYPVANVISVMATNEHDSKPGFSNYGKTTVHLGAPGTRILSTDCYFTVPRWRNYSGTSAACAFVAGAAAALKAMNPGWTPADILAHLNASVAKVPRWLPCIAEGRLSLARAVLGPLSITAPVAGAVWKVGANQSVTWTSSYPTPGCTSVSVLFSPDGGANYPTILAGQAVGPVVPVGPPTVTGIVVPNAPGANARIKLVSEQGPGLFDQSGIFTVVP
jgi:subtilisin family serine protease